MRQLLSCLLGFLVVAGKEFFKPLRRRERREANEELVKVLAERFDVPKSKIRIKSGLSSRQKLIEINTDA